MTPAPAAGSAMETIKQEIFDLFARYGSGEYTPTEQEKEILDEGLNTLLEDFDRLRGEVDGLNAEVSALRKARHSLLEKVAEERERAEHAEAALRGGVVVPEEPNGVIVAAIQDFPIRIEGAEYFFADAGCKSLYRTVIAAACKSLYRTVIAAAKEGK